MSDKPPFFTIFSAQRNAGVYAAHNILSIIEQTFADWELIFVDDASTDSTPNIVKHEALLDTTDRIRIVYNCKRLFKLRNFLHQLPSMRGQVIVDLDGDDRFATPHALQTIYDIYKDPRVDATFGYFRSDTNAWGGSSFDLLPSIFDLRLKQNHPTPRTFRRSLIQRLILEVPDCTVDPNTGTTWRIVGDESLFFGAIALARKIVPIREVLVQVTRANADHHDHIEFTNEQLDCGKRITEFWHDWADRIGWMPAGDAKTITVASTRDEFLQAIASGNNLDPYLFVSGTIRKATVDRWLNELTGAGLIRFTSHDPPCVGVTEHGRRCLISAAAAKPDPFEDAYA